LKLQEKRNHPNTGTFGYFDSTDATLGERVRDGLDVKTGVADGLGVADIDPQSAVREFIKAARVGRLWDREESQF
jgi:hypothetical protein